MYQQRTLAQKVSCTGLGLHTGAPVRLSLHPARVGTGIRFVRHKGSTSSEIVARHESVSATSHATTLGTGDASVSTVEHLLAALYALGVSNARIEVDGRRLTDDEVLGFCLLFIIAGHETTTKMVANAVELLSRHPDQRSAIVADPSLVPGCVEEVLRFHNSTQYMHRTLTRDVSLHGQAMHAGDSVLLLIGSANRDEREFGPSAAEFDIRRAPGRHIAFGYGPHFCLGAGLARMEGRVALEELHRRIPQYEVDHNAKVRFHSGNVTGWTHLPIHFDPEPARGASAPI